MTKTHSFPFSKQQKQHNEIIVAEGPSPSVDDRIRQMSDETRRAELLRTYEIRSKGRLAKMQAAIEAQFDEQEPGKNYGRGSGLLAFLTWETDNSEHDKWSKRRDAHGERVGKLRAELHDILRNPEREDGVLGEANLRAMRVNMIKEAAQDERIAVEIKDELSAELKAFSDNVGRPIDSKSYVHRPAPNGAWRSSERPKPH